MLKALGGIPQTVAFSEVYLALESGVVDGTEGPLSNLYTQKQYEVQKQVTLTYHTISNYVVVTNKKFWEGLPPDIRTILEGAMKDASKLNDEVAAKDEAQAIAGIKASGKSQIYTPTPAEKALWVKALYPVQDEMASRVGKDAIVAIRAATGSVAPK